MSHPLTRTLPGARPSLNYVVMQYLLKTKNQLDFDPVVALSHFVEPGVVEPPLISGATAQSLEKRARFASFVNEKTDSSQDRKLTSFIRGLNQPHAEGKPNSAMTLFPFSGATSFFPRDKVGAYNNQVVEQARDQILQRLRKRCWNVMAKDEKALKLLEKVIDEGEVGDLTKGMEMMIEIMMKNKRIPYGYSFYLNEVKRMRAVLSKGTETNTFIESVKVKSVYQSAALVAQDFAFQLRNKSRSVRSVFSQIVKDILVGKEKGVEGIYVLCSGRLQGAEIARSESASYGKTSRTTFDQKKDYAFAEVSTRYGITGVKVWISYRKGR